MELRNSTVSDCLVIDVSKVHNDAGNITVVENHVSIPFDVERIYYLYDIIYFANFIIYNRFYYALWSYIICQYAT